MKKLRSGVAGIALLFVTMFTGVQAANAACYWAPPVYGNHVTYYNCQGPYQYSYYGTTASWYCYADWDWYAEWFWGKHDGPLWVYHGRTCTA